MMKVIEKFAQDWKALTDAQEIQKQGKLAFPTVASQFPYSINAAHQNRYMCSGQAISVDAYTVSNCEQGVLKYGEGRDKINEFSRINVNTGLGVTATFLAATGQFLLAGLAECKKSELIGQNSKPDAVDLHPQSAPTNGAGVYLIFAAGFACLTGRSLYESSKELFERHVTRKIIDGDIAVLEAKKRELSRYSL